MKWEHLRLVCTKCGIVEAHPHRVQPPYAATVGERERGEDEDERFAGHTSILRRQRHGGDPPSVKGMVGEHRQLGFGRAHAERREGAARGKQRRRR